MKANELRIGNLTSMGVVYLIEDDVFRVVNSEGDSIKNTFANIKPIPLTEEWLLKFGFEKEVESFYIHYDMTECISLKFHFDGWYIEDNDGGFVNTKPVKYVHQLQNLYFALTEDELTFKSE